ncbi:MAG: protein adenylyltransferase SelO family protein [Moraxella sp.]|nr:protein adenylyltransferase SelO family protein [Moraxella sp.]
MKHHHHYLSLDPALYHRQSALPLDNPILVHFNHDLYRRLSDEPADTLDWQGIIGADNEAFADEFRPLAMVYAGHQFGQWAGQLGDGRGLLLTQIIDNNGKLTDLHLKGAGRTPFSRFGDGRAMIDSTVREYLGGHALSSLGVKSSDALGFVVSDTLIARTQMVRAASLLRVSDCHIRLGHFEWIAAYKPELFGKFAYEMLATYYPHLDKNNLDGFLTQVCQNTAKLIAQWQLIGFSHGVMNTDNLNIAGSTLDFGPFGMMERFKPNWINNHSDHHGRYTYQNQPTIGHWNLQKWLSCFHLLSVKHETMTASLESYQTTFYHIYDKGVCQKLGLPHQQDSIDIAYEFISLLKTYELDYTNSFRALIALLDDASPHEQTLLNTLIAEMTAQGGQEVWADWATRYTHLIHQSTNKSAAISLMKQTNPVYILRNSMAQRAIDAVLSGEFGEVARLFDLLKSPFEVQSIATPDDITPTRPHDMLPISCMS